MDTQAMRGKVLNRARAPAHTPGKINKMPRHVSVQAIAGTTNVVAMTPFHLS